MNRSPRFPAPGQSRDSLPLAPTRTFARALLGTVGEASAEQIEKSGGALRAGDTTGTGGLQQQYDAQLRGTSGTQVLPKRRASPPSNGRPCSTAAAGSCSRSI